MEKDIVFHQELRTLVDEDLVALIEQRSNPFAAPRHAKPSRSSGTRFRPT
jgi:hypothetical protein